jgi:hypothetical protein
LKGGLSQHARIKSIVIFKLLLGLFHHTGFAGMIFIVESTEMSLHLLIRELRCKVLKNLSGEENQSTDSPAFARGYGVAGADSHTFSQRGSVEPICE